MARYWLGLLDQHRAEPAASTGYARVALDLPDSGDYFNPEPIIFCPAILPWPIVTKAALFVDASFGKAFIETLLTRPPDFMTPLPLAVDETEEAVVPIHWLFFRFVKARTPRPYGRYRYGRQAYGRWPDDAVVQFRMGARLLADKLPVPCGDWSDVEAGCTAWDAVTAPCTAWATQAVDRSTWNTLAVPDAAWAPAPTWDGRQCR